MGPLSVCPVCLSVMLVYCSQTVRWIKMKLGMEVGLGPGHIVLDGGTAPSPPKGHSPQFSAHVCYCQTAGWIKMPLGREVGLRPGDIVLDGGPSLPLKPGTAPTFRPMSIVAKRSPISATAKHLLHWQWIDAVVLLSILWSLLYSKCSLQLHNVKHIMCVCYNDVSSIFWLGRTSLRQSYYFLSRRTWNINSVNQSV